MNARRAAPIALPLLLAAGIACGGSSPAPEEPGGEGSSALQVHGAGRPPTKVPPHGPPPGGRIVDRDGDGVADSGDRCPDEPEDGDGFRDADGCPDPDNDQDGILDWDDMCPNEPESRNDFHDADGCPDGR